MLDWDDLRIFNAAAREGSFAKAGDRLSLDATTVARRMARLEDSLRTTLFVRSRRGLQLTAAGSELLGASEGVEAAVERLGAAESFASTLGMVRLSTSEGFGAHLLAPAVPALLAARPGLHLELVANAGFLSASSREADIAVTLGPPSSTRLTVERLTDYSLSLYGATSYLDARGRPENVKALIAHDFVGYIDDLIYASELRYLREVHPDLHVRTTSSSITAQLELTRAGAGLCVLPNFLAATAAELEAVLPGQVRLTRSFYISVHRELQETLRIRIVRDWLLATVRAKASLLLPRQD